MCGIVGVVGNTNATDILIQGLEKLEYRGYDSAGIFVVGDNKSQLVKSVGRIAELQAKVGDSVSGTTGIGHTRWATHGKPTEGNAHPHTSGSGRFVLVHNGVIENYLQIKETYLTKHNLKGETDTEIAIHLVEHFVEEDNLSVLEAFKKALHIIEGSYAFALIDSQDADTIYVAKNKSPLLIGLGNGYNMVCSDAMAMIRETSEYMEIHDKELVIVKKDSVEVQDYDGNVIERGSYTAELDLSDIGKGTYPFYMLKEIDEQPTVMRKLISTYANESGDMNVDSDIIKSVQEADRLYILAAGTSYHAGFAAKTMIEKLTDTPVELGVSSEWGYNMPLLSKKPMFILLSQSGETADSRQVLVKANEMGIPSLTITNVPGSTLSREATYTMLIHAGPEIAVASTKAYTAQVAT
ncbi:glutamine--fructose-6-phosphate transaminase (isomerizing), partial [Streptococcus agalactiae]